jgi:hypothetical protein
MNKFKLMAIAFVFGTASLFASTITNPEVSGDEIRSQIVALVDASAKTLESPISVEITFSFNSEGEIVILKVQSRDKEILDFIRTNINGEKLENPGKMRKKYEMFITVK